MNGTQFYSADYWGEIPQDWQFIPIKYGFNLIGSGTTPPTGQEEYFGGSIPWVTTSELRENCITSTTQTVSELAVAEFSALKIFPKNTVLIAMYGATIGRVAILGVPACVNQAICALAEPICFEPQYVSYALQASRDYLLSLASGGGQPNLNAEKIKSHYIPCPSLSEQQAIANYLDHETVKIDKLISAKERLLDLLTEKRQSLITNVITCGLNPDVPMRDSGIEWIGNIPQHWEVEHLKYHIAKIEQGWSPQCDNFPADEDEWGVLKVGAVNAWEFNPDENKRLPTDLKPLTEYEIKPGDILISRANTTELVGSAALVDQVRSKLILCDKLYRLKMYGNRLYPEYLVFYLRSIAGRFEFERDATGASNSMQNISQEIVTNLWIPIPPIDEQNQIVDHIKANVLKLDNLTVAAKRTIELLQERRTALITAAVTGQIKVTA
ncbi:restriction endonuclease subunit S [Anabaena sp. FACHB-1391]|uniref:restriction endonuclease subunit S n=1 Tax=Anabaena sp. FACHB-1391 TaxID=2692771 RepID=UPI001681C037|nr:restriction endonuclease subunit S [Anabaena sp. FACHB-1391]MBD2270941.1 restriction endonuclease subunit S [Anabaena sp. FACHB-1391]